MTEEILWSCDLKEQSSQAPPSGLTVGQVFRMECRGPDVAAPFSPSAQFVFADEVNRYSLHILSVTKSRVGEAEFIVTGYKPGQYSLESVLISDGKVAVRVPNLKWEVSSVIKPQQGQQPQPYGPLGPFTMSYPWWLWASVTAVIALGGLVTYWRLRRRWDRQRLLERLSASQSPLPPYHQFYKELRAMIRRFHGRTAESQSPEEYLKQLDESFRAYITRELLVPAQEWSDRAVIVDVKKRHRGLYKEAGGQLKAVLSELTRARSAKAITFTDCEQLHDISRRAVDQIHRLKEGSK